MEVPQHSTLQYKQTRLLSESSSNRLNMMLGSVSVDSLVSAFGVRFQKGVLPEVQKWPRGGGSETVSLGRTCASSSALFLKFYMFLRVITELYVRL